MLPPRPVFNFAAFGTASQSCADPYWNGVTSLAIDGNRDTNFNNGSVTYTCNVFQPWWKVDLAFEIKINKIIIWNRMDDVSERLLNKRF